MACVILIQSNESTVSCVGGSSVCRVTELSIWRLSLGYIIDNFYQ